ncbi:neuropeptide FF receptor 2-like [Montipora foliosa]|uniref:neuropeptide FF receptor 2-like n=1 Tax=Montipora foliosa TaxID=591990 RepID=UPI0035F18D07
MSNSTDVEIPGETKRQAMLGFYIGILIVGFAGNSLVMAVVAGKRHKRSVYDLFILNLGISDFSFIVFTMPTYIYENVKGIYKTLYYCRIVQPLLTIFYFLSIFTITSMAIHRCRLITNPHKPKIKKKFVYLWIGFIWISSLITVLPLSIVAYAEDGRCQEDWPSLNHRKAYTVALFLLQFVLPLLTIAVAYVRIGIYLWRTTVPDNSLSEGKNKKPQKRRHENIQVIKTLALIVFLFAVCLLPGQIAWLLFDFGGARELKVSMVIFHFSDILDCLHGCVNPIIYGFLTEQFRRKYVEYFSYCFTCRRKKQLMEPATLMAENTEN